MLICSLGNMTFECFDFYADGLLMILDQSLILSVKGTIVLLGIPKVVGRRSWRKSDTVRYVLSENNRLFALLA